MSVRLRSGVKVGERDASTWEEMLMQVSSRLMGTSSTLFEGIN